MSLTCSSVDGRVRHYDLRMGKLHVDFVGSKCLSGLQYVLLTLVAVDKTQCHGPTEGSFCNEEARTKHKES